MKEQSLIDDMLQKLQVAGLSRETIVLLTHRLVELRFPNAKVEAISDEELRISNPDGSSHIMYLGNMLTECEQEPEGRAAIVDRYIRIIAGPDIEQKVTTLENIVTLVRDAQFLDVVTEGVVLAKEHIAGDLWLLLARDDEESVTTLREDEACKLSTDLRSLFSQGIDNVSELLQGLSAEPYGECYSLQAENLFYVSSVIAIDWVWDQMANLVDGDIVLGVPARDAVLFCGAENPKGLEELRNEVDYVLRNGHHLISNTLFRRVAGKWQVFS